MEDEGWAPAKWIWTLFVGLSLFVLFDSLEGIISTMAATMLHTEQIRAESSPSTMLIELSFLHAVCSDMACIGFGLVDMAVFECEEAPNCRPLIDVGRRVLALTVDCMLSKFPLVF